MDDRAEHVERVADSFSGKVAAPRKEEVTEITFIP